MGERLFVGHVILHADADGSPLTSFGSDWDEALLTKEKGEEVMRDGMSEAWLLDIAQKIVSSGAAIMHFYLMAGATKAGTGVVDIDDCDPRCPAAAQARALFAPRAKAT